VTHACYREEMRRRRSLTRIVLVFVAVCGSALSAPRLENGAQASVSIAVTWDGLLGQSTAAAVVTPLDTRSVWENGRIYTYTHVHVDRSIAGDLATGSDAWVRTMGGVVGKIGQMVEGEPAFAAGKSLLFLHPGPIGAFEVTARAQGQFSVVVDRPSASVRVLRNQAVGAIVPSRGAAQLAADRIHGRTVDDVAHDVATAWPGTHAR